MKYQIIPRKNPQNNQETPKYYAQIVRPSAISLDMLSKRIAEISPLSELDTQTALLALSQVLPEYFAKGATVHLGDLGLFQTTINSKAAESPEEFTTDLIKGISVRYRAGVKVKRRYEQVEFKKV